MDIRDILQKIDKVQNPRELTSEIVKSNLTEAAAISVNMYGNNPDEVQALYQIFKNAGLQSPVPAVMGPVAAEEKTESMPAPSSDEEHAEMLFKTHPEYRKKYKTVQDFMQSQDFRDQMDHLSAKASVGEDDRYKAKTTPDPKYATIPDTVDPTSDDLHKKKKMYARSQPGDNPMAVEQEEISLAEKIKSQLTQDYAAFKEGAVKGWMMDMEQDAAEMNRNEFIKKHGQNRADIWDRVNSEEDQFDGNTEDIELE